MLRKGETICAPATSAGGAIAVIRMSGPQSFTITERVFFASDKTLDINKQPGNMVIHGEIRDGLEIIDEVLLTVFRAPRSYTGEDSVEISCHASKYIITRVLELLLRYGAIAALPGEFTQRAFFNGKMDLSQAEAVADLVASSSKASHDIAMNQMRGGFSAKIAKLRSVLLRFASLIELELDFGEEDVEFADRQELMKIIMEAKGLTDDLASSFSVGNAIKNGIPVAIIGKPNSGKSTLLNALLNEERAIVSEIPGTTRDTIEDTIIINGVEYRFTDTAGLRDTSDVIENLGIRKTHEKIGQSSVVLFVDDILDEAGPINRRISNVRDILKGSGTSLIILINKSDLLSSGGVASLKEQIITQEDELLLFISAKQRTGLDELRREVDDLAVKKKLKSDDVIITNIRHYEAMINVSKSLGRIISGIDEKLPEDLIAIDLRQAIHYLGEVTGEITSDEILDNIFRNFCIGK